MSTLNQPPHFPIGKNVIKAFTVGSVQFQITGKGDDTVSLQLFFSHDNLSLLSDPFKKGVPHYYDLNTDKAYFTSADGVHLLTEDTFLYTFAKEVKEALETGKKPPDAEFNFVKGNNDDRVIDDISFNIRGISNMTGAVEVYIDNYPFINEDKSVEKRDFKSRKGGSIKIRQGKPYRANTADTSFYYADWDVPGNFKKFTGQSDKLWKLLLPFANTEWGKKDPDPEPTPDPEKDGKPYGVQGPFPVRHWSPQNYNNYRIPISKTPTLYELYGGAILAMLGGILVTAVIVKWSKDIDPDIEEWRRLQRAERRMKEKKGEVLKLKSVSAKKRRMAQQFIDDADSGDFTVTQQSTDIENVEDLLKRRKKKIARGDTITGGKKLTSTQLMKEIEEKQAIDRIIKGETSKPVQIGEFSVGAGTGKFLETGMQEIGKTGRQIIVSGEKLAEKGIDTIAPPVMKVLAAPFTTADKITSKVGSKLADAPSDMVSGVSRIIERGKERSLRRKIQKDNLKARHRLQKETLKAGNIDKMNKLKNQQKLALIKGGKDVKHVQSQEDSGIKFGDPDEPTSLDISESGKRDVRKLKELSEGSSKDVASILKDLGDDDDDKPKPDVFTPQSQLLERDKVQFDKYIPGVDDNQLGKLTGILETDNVDEMINKSGMDQGLMDNPEIRKKYPQFKNIFISGGVFGGDNNPNTPQDQFKLETVDELTQELLNMKTGKRIFSSGEVFRDLSYIIRNSPKDVSIGTLMKQPSIINKLSDKELNKIHTSIAQRKAMYDELGKNSKVRVQDFKNEIKDMKKRGIPNDEIRQFILKGYGLTLKQLKEIKPIKTIVDPTLSEKDRGIISKIQEEYKPKPKPLGGRSMLEPELKGSVNIPLGEAFIDDPNLPKHLLERQKGQRLGKKEIGKESEHLPKTEEDLIFTPNKKDDININKLWYQYNSETGKIDKLQSGVAVKDRSKYAWDSGVNFIRDPSNPNHSKETVDFFTGAIPIKMGEYNAGINLKLKGVDHKFKDYILANVAYKLLRSDKSDKVKENDLNYLNGLDKQIELDRSNYDEIIRAVKDYDGPNGYINDLTKFISNNWTGISKRLDYNIGRGEVRVNRFVKIYNELIAGTNRKKKDFFKLGKKVESRVFRTPGKQKFLKSAPSEIFTPPPTTTGKL